MAENLPQGLQPPVFNGEGYAVSAIKMEVYMQGQDLWEPVEDDYVVEVPAEDATISQLRWLRERITKKARARSCLYQALAPSIFTKIMKMNSAKKIWDFLKEEYQGDERVKHMKVLNFMREFDRLQMKDGESVKSYAERLCQLADQMRLLDVEFKDERIVQKLLISVPEKYEPTIASLENSKDMSSIKLAEVVTALQAQEQRHLMRNGDFTEGAYKASIKKVDQEKNKNAKYNPCSHCGKSNNLAYRCWKRPDVICRKCNEKGHMEAICKQQSAEAQVVEEQEQLFLTTCDLNN